MLINMFDIIIRINNFFTILASGDESKYNIANICNRNLLSWRRFSAAAKITPAWHI